MSRPSINRSEASAWAIRLADALDPHPGSNERLWYLLDQFRDEAHNEVKAAITVAGQPLSEEWIDAFLEENK